MQEVTAKAVSLNLGKEESDELEPIDPKDAFTHSGLKAPQNTPGSGLAQSGDPSEVFSALKERMAEDEFAAAGATGADDDAVQQFILSLPKPVQVIRARLVISRRGGVPKRATVAGCLFLEDLSIVQSVAETCTSSSECQRKARRTAQEVP